jgi:hypothetical protein
MAAEDYAKLSDSEKKKEDWMNSKWRPMMGWSYMLTCICDFVVFPVAWSVLQALTHGNVSSQWQPITLQGAGLFHLAMGAVLGIAAYGRTQEKLGGANNGGIQISQPSTPSVSAPAGNFGSGASSATSSAPGFGSSPSAASSAAPSSFGSAPATPAFGSVTTSASGKPGPAQPDHPEI